MTVKVGNIPHVTQQWHQQAHLPPAVHGLNVTFEKRKTRSQHEAQGASKKPN